MLLSDKLMSCRAVGTNGCTDLRRRALNGQMNTEWNRCPDSMARCARDSVVPMRRSTAGWVPASIGRVPACVECGHPVTGRKTSLMTESMRQV